MDAGIPARRTVTDQRLIFIKLGGSLITDKNRRATPRIAIQQRLAEELRTALAADPGLRVLLGHGSGSFGHWEASRYDTRHGVRSPEQWIGFARVGAAAARLNRIVADTFLKAGVPVLSLQPSACTLAEEGKIVSLDTQAIERALSGGLVPLIFGDVAFDRAWGGTILSTEDLFFHLAQDLRPDRILLLGNAPGVLDDTQTIIPHITPANYPEYRRFLRGSRYTDVTGGMADKVERMVDLVQRMPNLQIWILTGQESGNLSAALSSTGWSTGTRISAAEPTAD